MTDAIRTWIEDNRDEMVQPWLRDALCAVLEVNEDHLDLLTGRGRYPERINECHCLGCQSIRAIADALGVSDD
jgi:hypothetical protein